MLSKILTLLGAILIGFSGFVIGPIVKKTIIRLAKNAPDVGAFTFLGSCASVLIKVVTIIMALSHIGIDISILVGGLSAVGLGVSLALKDNMANVAGGMQILFTKPFVVGDYIKIGDKEGKVERIEIMFLVLKTPDDQDVIVPNSTAISSIIVNYRQDDTRRIHIAIDVNMKEDIEMLQRAFMEIIDDHEKVIVDMEKLVVIDNVNANSYTLGIYCHVLASDYWPTYYDLNALIQKKRLEMEIEAPLESIQLKSDQAA